ncbi:MAG: hypothetical protein A2Y98_01195 [Candidatus Portnoybacteria bacterium RBG_19FT_COMBO_36_7]|uniref:Transglutaminase-like domain-containing protein n=1 Tax=Candidatus Portnoybacteria bacterium RBG_19FT_COMBO_36_7 TaxID=1801992 RepID=A0A1G2F6X5_9BACT|nr:MAG: hypothetical protein A2Y98_01195 [Candidatus Portnoybacteria bacterium RBG_19FT_COMBO_36_7]
MNKQIKKYLKSGQQTEITPKIIEIASTFKNEGLELIFEMLQWVQKNIKDTDSVEFKKKFFRKRTADEIIKSKVTTGCTDYALVFIAFARVRKIPTVYVEAIRRKWLDIGDEKYIEGHIFAECFIDSKWYIVNPEEGAIQIAYHQFVIFDKGLDSWNIGIKKFNDLKNKFLKFKEEYRKKKS